MQHAKDLTRPVDSVEEIIWENLEVNFEDGFVISDVFKVMTIFR
jgi:hypothetical protein